ncbi:unnamed protein product [Pipistrellus nathusii]|uniref:Uncharacterized protein n=1 Tax=Pipistrellus nathusii TaxID=59473 RepID=A0ABN9ZB92_PIPNA
MGCCSLEVVAELLLELVCLSHRKHRSCLIYGGKAFPEFTCGYPCCVLLCNDLTSENEEGSRSSETPCGHPSIPRPSMWRSVPGRIQGVTSNPAPQVPRKGGLGNLTQSMRTLVSAQRLKGTESLIPTMIARQPTSRH